ncbi:MAG: M23 family metallopeptidase [Dysgonamonadaceae bacterium]|jgi:murein DD-endopeptidase MepM/ murein hydrolase activator NlpD|nr:M23 family metallopeptidase [Dysgonamonadaceae bacterium]
MSNIFYKYNQETLNYERVYPSLKQRIWVVFRQLLIGILIGTGLFALAFYYFDSPREQQLKKENKLILAQYQVLSRRIDENEKILTDLQGRDENLYRSFFNAEPVPASIRQLGVGGVNRYEELLNIPNSKLVIETTRKLDLMTRKMYVQSNSYDELVELAKTKEERIKHIPSIQPLKGINKNRMSSGFGMRMHPVYGNLRFHSGIDFNVEIGTPIYATGDGVVESAKYNGGYGNCVVIDHGFGYKSLYGHCKDLLVRPGQKVTRGEQIATVGMTGTTSGPHVHYEVHVKNQPDNPAKYFFMDLDPKEYEEIMELSDTQ